MAGTLPKERSPGRWRCAPARSGAAGRGTRGSDVASPPREILSPRQKGPDPMQVGSTLTMEKPQNGIAGLKQWRYDMTAGLVVSLISLPFSLGIAVASGAPPICGLISAIIAGLILPFLGGSYVTVSGPAAGLAPVLFASMMLLGRGDREVGYPLLLGAICLTGLVQIILAKLKLARFAAIFPASVVEGMLASIGLLIIAKQLPLIFGSPGNHFEAHEF